MQMSDEIANSLGLNPIEKVEPKLEILESNASVPSVDVSEKDKDYKYARENFYNVIEKGTHALDEMLDVAKASEHPRAYEVVSTLMKTLIEANKDLVSMNEKKNKSEEPAEEKSVTNNNLFLGSTSELQRLIKDLKQND